MEVEQTSIRSDTNSTCEYLDAEGEPESPSLYQEADPDQEAEQQNHSIISELRDGLSSSRDTSALSPEPGQQNKGLAASEESLAISTSTSAKTEDSIGGLEEEYDYQNDSLWQGQKKHIFAVHNADRGNGHLGGITHCRVLGHHVVLCVQEDAEIGQPGDRIELHIGIGEDSTAPEASVREFPCLLRLLLHKMGVHGVAIEEQDDAIPKGNVGGKIEGITQMRRRLVQIKDQVAQPTAKQVRTHSVVQGALLVAIVHAGSST